MIVSSSRYDTLRRLNKKTIERRLSGEGRHLADDDAERWRLIVQRQGPALLLFARQWSASRADAEDALQNGFLKFWQTRATARDELAYLYACVRSAAMDIGRSRRRRGAHEANVPPAEESAFVSSIERIEREAVIESALNQLPGDQREVIVMKIWGGLTFAQIGEALNVSLNTAASRYRYALARLQTDLTQELARE
jgi:RNA polymerase sigma-70 factor (ECF subfamily)